MSALPVNWTWNDLPPSFSASLCHVLLHLLRVPWAPEFLFKSISFPFLFSLSSVLRLSHLTEQGETCHHTALVCSFHICASCLVFFSSPSSFSSPFLPLLFPCKHKNSLCLWQENASNPEVCWRANRRNWPLIILCRIFYVGCLWYPWQQSRVHISPLSPSRMGGERMKRGDKITHLLKCTGQAITC